MKKYTLQRVTVVCAILVLIAAFNVSVQSHSTNYLELSRKNPDGWFTLDLPNTIGKVERHADIDGGVYSTDTLEINYDYWTFQNTPNWLRGKYATSLLLYCAAKDKNVRTWRTKIDGKKAVIQRCSMTDSRKGFRHLYYVTFPKLRVSDGQGFHPGMFSSRVEYKDPRYSRTAARIIYSLDFER